MDYQRMSNEDLAEEFSRTMKVSGDDALAYIEKSDESRQWVVDLLTARTESEQAIARSRDAVERFRAALH